MIITLSPCIQLEFAGLPVPPVSLRGLSVLDAATLDRVSIPWLTETMTWPRASWCQWDLQRGEWINTYGGSESPHSNSTTGTSRSNLRTRTPASDSESFITDSEAGTLSVVELDSVTAASVDSDSAPFQRQIALMRLCLDSDPAKRPDSRAVFQQLVEIEAVLAAFRRAMSESSEPIGTGSD